MTLDTIALLAAAATALAGIGKLIHVGVTRKGAEWLTTNHQ